MIDESIASELIEDQPGLAESLHVTRIDDKKDQIAFRKILVPYGSERLTTSQIPEDIHGIFRLDICKIESDCGDDLVCRQGHHF